MVFTIENFWTNVNKTEDCWLYTGYINEKGYGQVYKDEKMIRAHRVSWILAGNTIPNGYLIRHKCRSRNCVNPEHLETGTQRENMNDKIRDGTLSHKLTEEQVRQIKTRTGSGEVIAKEFGVTRQTINNIRSGKSWSFILEV